MLGRVGKAPLMRRGMCLFALQISRAIEHYRAQGISSLGGSYDDFV